MGYDALSTHYDALHSAISAFSPQATSANNADIQAFLQTTVGGAIDKIQQLFPDAQSLATIDTTELNLVLTDEKEANLPTESDLQPSSELDQLLAGLPSIDDHERDILLSKSLDETFLSMKNGDLSTGTMADMEADQDPMAMQFSAGMDDCDTESSPSDTALPDSQAASFFNDFVEDANDNRSGVFAEKVTEADETMAPGDDDGGVDLWPKAKTSPEPIPEIEVQESKLATPAIDFSIPPASESPASDQKQQSETDTQEGFAARSAVRKSIRVDADKVDYLMNQVGELVVNRSSFSQLFSEMRELANYLYQRFSMDKADQRLINDLTNRLNDATTILGRVTSDLQEQVMKVRMLPISRLFNRYPRLVHDLLRDADKKVQLQFRGEETELDRMVIEQLADPMIHIIRNAVDHGIESIEARRRKGKQDSGILLLEAYHEGSNVVIEVTDDGKGIDLSRIRQKAVEKNIADRKTLDEMDQQALIDLIMLPGFSTTDQITHTSGRGVGMDVVKQSIEKINGSLKIETRQDVGTRFRIKIPLTLAIIPAMMIKCANRHFTVPMSAVEETLRIHPGEIFTVDGSEIMHLREEPLPLVKLSDLLNIKTSQTKEIDDRFFVVVLKGAAGRTGFIVDTLLGRQEVVIKPMEDYLQENSGFSGATILGDGNISLVLNVDELVIMAKEREAERKLAAAVL
jgi:two-component system chemotaxis sensor kinase CheA